MPTPTAASVMAWLPDHQLHVLGSLGHIDDQMQNVAELIQAHSRAGTFDLRNDAVGDRMHTIIVGVHPIPAAVSRSVGDVVSALRGVLEHVVFAEVEHRADRGLSEVEERALEVPALPASDQFDKWVRDKRRRDLPGLGEGGELTERLRKLQPFAWNGDNTAPLRLLVDHSNVSKHRRPAMVAARLGRVVADFDVPGMQLAEPSGQPAQDGDLIADAPLRPRVGLDLWPIIALRRPGTDSWPVLMAELSLLETWTREVALPTLLNLGPGQDLPAATDVHIGHVDSRAAGAAAAGHAPAATRNQDRLVAEGVVRPAFKDELRRRCSTPSEVTATAGWVDSLGDAEVIRRWDRFVAIVPNAALYAEAAGQLIRTAVRWEAQQRSTLPRKTVKR
ncbi:hypothetical protein [Curtobacterium sp. MCPF17_031]|uniref:hypothetical protein n=1 Tax=Curtobacterium sp. MCPF17_031 TaxID=2175653 RepID=UPI0011B63968|nr:hypothetical protein [Curtobacterium sp. MCPF17_031]